MNYILDSEVEIFVVRFIARMGGRQLADMLTIC